MRILFGHNSFLASLALSFYLLFEPYVSLAGQQILTIESAPIHKTNQQPEQVQKHEPAKIEKQADKTGLSIEKMPDPMETAPAVRDNAPPGQHEKNGGKVLVGKSWVRPYLGINKETTFDEYGLSSVEGGLQWDFHKDMSLKTGIKTGRKSGMGGVEFKWDF